MKNVKKTQEQAVADILPNLSPELSLEKFIYVNAQTKSTVTCEVHGDLLMLPNKLKVGQGCGKCKASKLSLRFIFTQEQALCRNHEAHGNLYTYERFIYQGNNVPAIITCRSHGDYLQAPEKHWSGRHCPQCSKETYVAWNKRSSLDTKTQANDVHYNRYLYLDERGYENCKEYRDVTCNDHGAFSVTMDNHINFRSGCPKCSGQISLAELDLKKYVESLGLKCVSSFKLPSNKHIDIFIPSLNIGIEYNGLYFPSEEKRPIRYHLEKHNEALSQGITLIQVFEDEYLNKRKIVLDCLSTKLGTLTTSTYARNLLLEEIPKALADKFFEETHLQGATGSTSKTWGLRGEAGIVVAMSFSPSNVADNQVELTRFASKGRVVGGFSRLLKAAVSTFQLEGYLEIVSFSDNRWSDGRVYLTNGFTNTSDVPPNYWWCKGSRRFHKRGFQRKYLEAKLEVFNPELSEAENCQANGYFKVWDAGLKKWSLQI